MKRLLLAAFAADEVDRIAPRPGIWRVADGAERFARQHGSLAVIAGERKARRVYVDFTTDFVANRATPAHGHFGRNTSLNADEIVARIVIKNV